MTISSANLLQLMSNSWKIKSVMSLSLKLVKRKHRSSLVIFLLFPELTFTSSWNQYNVGNWNWHNWSLLIYFQYNTKLLFDSDSVIIHVSVFKLTYFYMYSYNTSVYIKFQQRYDSPINLLSWKKSTKSTKEFKQKKDSTE